MMGWRTSFEQGSPARRSVGLPETASRTVRVMGRWMPMSRTAEPAAASPIGREHQRNADQHQIWPEPAVKPATHRAGMAVGEKEARGEIGNRPVPRRARRNKPPNRPRAAHPADRSARRVEKSSAGIAMMKTKRESGLSESRHPRAARAATPYPSAIRAKIGKTIAIEASMWFPRVSARRPLAQIASGRRHARSVHRFRSRCWLEQGERTPRPAPGCGAPGSSADRTKSSLTRTFVMQMRPGGKPGTAQRTDDFPLGHICPDLNAAGDPAHVGIGGPHSRWHARSRRGGRSRPTIRP